MIRRYRKLLRGYMLGNGRHLATALLVTVWCTLGIVSGCILETRPWTFGTDGGADGGGDDGGAGPQSTTLVLWNDQTSPAAIARVTITTENADGTDIRTRHDLLVDSENSLPLVVSLEEIPSGQLANITITAKDLGDGTTSLRKLDLTGASPNKMMRVELGSACHDGPQNLCRTLTVEDLMTDSPAARQTPPNARPTGCQLGTWCDLNFSIDAQVQGIGGLATDHIVAASSDGSVSRLVTCPTGFCWEVLPPDTGGRGIVLPHGYVTFQDAVFISGGTGPGVYRYVENSLMSLGAFNLNSIPSPPINGMSADPSTDTIQMVAADLLLSCPVSDGSMERATCQDQSAALTAAIGEADVIATGVWRSPDGDTYVSLLDSVDTDCSSVGGAANAPAADIIRFEPDLTPHHLDLNTRCTQISDGLRRLIACGRFLFAMGLNEMLRLDLSGNDKDGWQRDDGTNPYALLDGWCSPTNEFFAVGRDNTIFRFDGTTWTELTRSDPPNADWITTWGTREAIFVGGMKLDDPVSVGHVWAVYR